MKILILRDDGGEPIARQLQHYIQCPVEVHSLTGSIPQDLDKTTICIMWPTSRRWIPDSRIDHPHRSRLVDVAETLLAKAKILAELGRAVLLVSLTVEPERPGLGLLSYRAFGERYFRDYVNLNLAERVSECSNIYMLDASRWYRRATKQDSRLRRYFLTKTDMNNEETRHAVEDIVGMVRAMEGIQKRVIALDLDNTLWGGILGECGSENLSLGGHDPIGEAYAMFQAELVKLQSRGVILVLVSKNDEKTALNAIQNHPEMVLNLSHFSAYRINWENKATNLKSISEELNLPLHHFIFIDDSKFERGVVNELLPMVMVPDWPTDPLLFVESLWGINELQSNNITDEDSSRGQMYAAERARVTAQKDLDYSSWLNSAELCLCVDILGIEQLTRAHQLFVKTNQFNTSMRRHSKDELLELMKSHVFLTYRLSDRFGEYGMIGVIGIAKSTIQDSIHITDFVLSCRAFDRGVQDAMIAFFIAPGLPIDIDYRATLKNKKSHSWLESNSLNTLSETYNGLVRLDKVKNSDHITVRLSPDVIDALLTMNRSINSPGMNAYASDGMRISSRFLSEIRVSGSSEPLDTKRQQPTFERNSNNVNCIASVER